MESSDDTTDECSREHLLENHNQAHFFEAEIFNGNKAECCRNNLLEKHKDKQANISHTEFSDVPNLIYSRIHLLENHKDNEANFFPVKCVNVTKVEFSRKRALENHKDNQVKVFETKTSDETKAESCRNLLFKKHKDNQANLSQTEYSDDTNSECSGKHLSEILKDEQKLPKIKTLKETDANFCLGNSYEEKNKCELAEENRELVTNCSIIREEFVGQFPKFWKKGNRIGNGASGRVFMIIDEEKPDDNQFVVKEIDVNSAHKDENLKSFLKEIKILTLLKDHHRIVPYIGHSNNDDVASIFMKYMSMGSLTDLVQNTKLSEERCLLYTYQILEGLDYLHSQLIIHRDIKGANVLLENEENIRIADFGISKFVDLNTQNFTGEAGTYRYMAPEVCNPSPAGYSCTADIWSLGCTVYEMITGKFPYFDIDIPAAVIYKVATGTHPQIPDDASKTMKKFLKKTFVLDHLQRMSAKELIESFLKDFKENGTLSKGNKALYSESTHSGSCLQFVKCQVNPGHKYFTPARDFTVEHLSHVDNIKDRSTFYELIKTVAGLTVKINVRTVSKNRPQFWPESLTRYPYHTRDEESTNRTGTGIVYSVKQYTVDDSKNCKCSKCGETLQLGARWGEIEIVTASHVVYDEIEAKNTICTLFFDDDNDESSNITLDKLSIVNSDIDKNCCKLKCSTQSVDLLNKLNKLLEDFEMNLPVEHNASHGTSKFTAEIGFIVSHPHGKAKQISTGYLLNKTDIDSNWSQFTYNIPACPGSSGAYVYIQGENSFPWYYPHLHTGCYSKGFNYSSVGFQGANVLLCLDTAENVSKAEKCNENYDELFKTYKNVPEIPANWYKGQLIKSGRFSKIYTLMDPDLQAETSFIVKETILPKDKLLKRNIVSLWKNGYDINQMLPRHESIAVYYSLIHNSGALSLILKYYQMGSIADFYHDKGPISEDLCFLFANQILGGLNFLHENNIIHMDIRGKNIYLKNEECVQISGFKYAHNRLKEQRITRHGDVRWTAPEVINQKFEHLLPSDLHKLDIWSLGCTVVELLTAKVPYYYIQSKVEVILHVGKRILPHIVDLKPISDTMGYFLKDVFKTNPKLEDIISKLMDTITSSRCKRRTVMPPTLHYRYSSNSSRSAKKYPGARMCMRAWLEDLLDQEACRGLAWKNKREKIFTVVWRHSSSHKFEQSEHGDIFYRWAQHTGKNRGKEQSDHSGYKNNFRFALHSLKDCIELTNPGERKGEKATRTFQFIDPSHPKYKTQKELKKIKEELGLVKKMVYKEVPQPNQQTLVQSLHAGENIPVPIQSSISNNMILFNNETLLTHSAYLNLNMLLDRDDQQSQSSLCDLGSDAREQNKNSEGITTFILPNSSNRSAGTSESQDKQRSQISLLTKNPCQSLQSLDTHKSFTSLLNTKLNCGGNVTINKLNQELLPLSIPKAYPILFDALWVSVNTAQTSHSLDADDTYTNLTSLLNTKLTCGGNVKIKKMNQETLPLSLPLTFPITYPLTIVSHTSSDLDLGSSMEIQENQVDIKETPEKLDENNSICNVASGNIKNTANPDKMSKGCQLL